MAQCEQKTKRGQCRRQSIPGTDWCADHTPAKSAPKAPSIYTPAEQLLMIKGTIGILSQQRDQAEAEAASATARANQYSAKIIALQRERRTLESQL